MSLARMAEPATTPRYERHRPEQTLLYQLVETHYPEFCAQLNAQGRRLPAYVRQEFEDFLRCGRLEHGFLRVRCEDCKHERLVAFSCKRRGFCRGRPVPVAAPDAWPRVRRCWWTRCCRPFPSVSGC